MTNITLDQWFGRFRTVSLIGRRDWPDNSAKDKMGEKQLLNLTALHCKAVICERHLPAIHAAIKQGRTRLA